jgi:phosphate transport system protein
MAMNTRANFDRELLQLREKVLQLGALARAAVTGAMQALVEGDPDLAHEVIAADVNINRLRYDIETECYAPLAMEQPIPRDLRIVSSALMVNVDLERIGDHGKKIARIYLRMLDDPRPIPTGDIPHLREIALTMLDRALRAMTGNDVAEARAVCKTDDEADALYKQAFNVAISHMLENPRLIPAGTHLIQLAHELERVADRATNVAERVIYTVAGELVDLNTLSRSLIVPSKDT